MLPLTLLLTCGRGPSSRAGQVCRAGAAGGAALPAQSILLVVDGVVICHFLHVPLVGEEADDRDGS